MAHEGAAPGTPGAPHIPPGQQKGRPPPANGGTGGGQGGADPSGFTASESIFGWSWLGEWAEDNAPPEVAAWLQGWVDDFNAAAEAELESDIVGIQTDVVVQNFLIDLAKQSWWKEKTALWQSVQKMRYGTDIPRGEYDALVQSYRGVIADAARQLGFVDANGNLTFDVNSVEITELIEGAEGLMLNAGTVGEGGFPVPDATATARLVEEYFLPTRTFDTIEGSPTIGAGELRDKYDWIKGLATNNFISLDDEEIWDMVFRLKREEITYQGVWDRISGHVGDRYDFLDGTNIMNRINQFSATEETGWGGGSNLKTHLAPVRDAVAATWGLTKGEVNLGKIFGDEDSMGLDGLTIMDENAPHGERFMNSREARQWAREQPQFLKTEEYGTGMQGMVQSILKLFGAR